MILQVLFYLDNKLSILVSRILGNYPIEVFHQKVVDHLKTYPEIRPGGPYVSVSDYSKGSCYLSFYFRLVKDKPEEPANFEVMRARNNGGFVYIGNASTQVPYERAVYKFVFLRHRSIKANMKRMYEFIQLFSTLDDTKI